MEYAPTLMVGPADKPEQRPALAAKLAEPLRAALEDAAEGVKTGAAVVRSAPLEPPKAGRLAEVAYGFALPLAVMRALLSDPRERTRYLVQAGARALVVAAGAALIAASGVWVTIHFGVFPPGTDFKAKAKLVGALLSSIYAIVAAVEWVVIALTHEFDSQVGRRAAIRAGVEPEDEEQKPRIRLDTRWIAKRIKRSIRGYRVYIIGIPAIAIVFLIPAAGPALYGLLIGLWSLYWIVVLTASKSAAAWADEGTAPEPWYLRLWTFATELVPGFRWSIPRAYGRAWRRNSEAIFAPCKAVEDAPYSMLGLTLCRMVFGLPGVYLFIRPFIPVAAASIIAASRRAALPEATALPAQPPETSASSGQAGA